MSELDEDSDGFLQPHVRNIPALSFSFSFVLFLLANNYTGVKIIYLGASSLKF